LKNVLGIHGASGNAISGPKDLIVVFPKEGFYLLGRTKYWSEVFYGLHAFLLHIVSSHETPPIESY
jgi:hypothetical protein